MALYCWTHNWGTAGRGSVRVVWVAREFVCRAVWGCSVLSEQSPLASVDHVSPDEGIGRASVVDTGTSPPLLALLGCLTAAPPYGLDGVRGVLRRGRIATWGLGARPRSVLRGVKCPTLVP